MTQTRGRYTKEQLDWIKENVKSMTHEELQEKFNQTFNQNRSFSAIKGVCTSRGWRNGGIGLTRRKYKKHHIDFVREKILEEYTIEEVADLFNDRFEIQTTKSGIANLMNKNNIKTLSNRGQFKKGMASFNKGLKQTDFMSPEAIERTKATRFQKGQESHNKRPVGSERFTREGFIEVKVAEPNVWKLKHRLVWEEANGEVPDKHVVTFLDGNKQNVALENLRLITMEENAYLNKNGLRYDDAELTEMGLNVAKVMTRTHQIIRGD